MHGHIAKNEIFHLPIDAFLLRRYSVPIDVLIDALHHAPRTVPPARPGRGFGSGRSARQSATVSTSTQSNLIYRPQAARAVCRSAVLNPQGGN